jgi:hypothetical protein
MLNIEDKYLRYLTVLAVVLFIGSLAGGITTTNPSLKIACLLGTSITGLFCVSIVTLLMVGSVFICDPEYKQTQFDADVNNEYYISRGGITKSFLERCQSAEYVYINDTYCDDWSETESCLHFSVTGSTYDIEIIKDHLQFASYGCNHKTYIVECPTVDAKLKFEFLT